MTRRSQAIARENAQGSLERPDDELVEGCLRGDSGALHRLYREHSQAVRRMVCLFGPAGSSAEDLVQDVFVRALEILPRYRGDAGIDVWLRGIALNLARTQLAKAQRRRRLLGPIAAIRGAAITPAHDGRVSGREALRRLRVLLDRLPRTEREAFALRRIERMSMEQVAAVTDTASSTVSDRVQRADRKLRAWMEADER